jgi:hypothetical protein
MAAVADVHRLEVCLRRLIAALLWRPQEVAVKLQFEGMEQRFRSDIRHGE